jgi:hypothetical protein
VRPRAATRSPSPALPATVPRCRCSGPPAARRVQATSDSQRQLHALVVAAPDGPAADYGDPTTPALVSTCGRLRLRADTDPETAATLIRAWHPELLTPTGLGPIVAAVVLCAWSRVAVGPMPPSP